MKKSVPKNIDFDVWLDRKEKAKHDKLYKKFKKYGKFGRFGGG